VSPIGSSTAHVIVMEGDTYRNPTPGRRRVKAASVVA
jgi:hypothetical protein